jgi:dipeptidyl-peptidase-3
LYYAIDPKLVEMGLMPSIDVGKTEYDHYIRNGLQAAALPQAPGGDVEEDHMRNRQLVAAWVYEKGLPDSVIERRVRDGKTYSSCGTTTSSARIRRSPARAATDQPRAITAAIRDLVEHYAVKVDP